MADVEKYGRTFSFEDGVSEEQQNTRILNWMKKNAADELESEKTAPTVEKAKDAPTKTKKFNPTLAAIGRALMSGLPGGVAAGSAMTERLGDVDTYRTIAQGALPFSDEAIAGVRSITGGPDYDTALAEERQGLKDYEDKYGTLDSILTQGVGAVGTIPIAGAGVLSALSKMPKLASLVKAHPWLSGVLTGAGTGSVAGFGAGEGGFDERAKSAAGMGALGAGLGVLGTAAAKGVEKTGNYLSTDPRVAAYLSKRIAGEKGIDVDDPDFINKAMKGLRANMREQQRLNTDPMLADVLPGTTEAVLQKPGKGTNELATTLLKRQYDADAPELIARETGQFGRVGDIFDTAFGTKMFKETDEALTKELKDNADALFGPAYQQYIKSPEIDAALEAIETIAPGVVKRAKDFAKAEMLNRTPGRLPYDRISGGELYYNTQSLHDIKRFLDEHLGHLKKDNPRFFDVPFINTKKALNNAMMDQNSQYRTAMEQFGEDMGWLNALKKGREEVFVPGSVDKTGAMDADAIKAYLNDPDVHPKAKEMFMIGAARALRENVLSGQSKKYTHNWADIINNPEMENRIGALVNGKQIGAWDLFRAQMKKESENFKNASRAMGNSRTNVRQELMKELEGVPSNVVSALGLAINPKAPSGWRGLGSAALDKLNRAEAMADKTANLLGRRGKKGNQSSLRDLERILREADARSDRFNVLSSAIAPYAAAHSWPFREE